MRFCIYGYFGLFLIGRSLPAISSGWRKCPHRPHSLAHCRTHPPPAHHHHHHLHDSLNQNPEYKNGHVKNNQEKIEDRHDEAYALYRRHDNIFEFSACNNHMAVLIMLKLGIIALLIMTLIMNHDDHIDDAEDNRNNDKDAKMRMLKDNKK